MPEEAPRLDVKCAPRLRDCIVGGHSVASEMSLLILTWFGVPLFSKPKCQGWT
jgi:hypothetical protein